MTTTTMPDARDLKHQMDRLEEKLDRILGYTEALEHRVEALTELREDFVPILNDAGRLASHRLQEWDRSGALGVVKEGLKMMETVATSFDEEDVRLLGENVVGILRTIRSLTQPEILEIADRAAEADTGKRAGLIRSMRDPDVRRGMTILMAVLRELGGEPNEEIHAAPALEAAGATS